MVTLGLMDKASFEKSEGKEEQKKKTASFGGCLGG